jgi:hypothetical protein
VKANETGEIFMSKKKIGHVALKLFPAPFSLFDLAFYYYFLFSFFIILPF